MRLFWLLLISLILLGEGRIPADPTGVDVSNAPAQATVADGDNPLASRKSPAPAAPSPIDQDAVNLLESPGSTAEKAFSGPSNGADSPPAADPSADSNVSPDLVNGNDSGGNPLGVPIRRAQRAPDSGAPTPPPVASDGELPEKNDAASPSPGASPQIAQVETAPSIQPAPSLAMKLRLNDLISLQKAAEEAGGSLQITVATVGINPEDLIVPLRKQGIFAVTIDKDSFMVSSKNDRLGQIDALTVKRRQLLEQIADLQSELDALNQKKVLAQTPSVAPDDADTPPSAQLPATPSPAADPSSGKPAVLILSNR